MSSLIVYQSHHSSWTGGDTTVSFINFILKIKRGKVERIHDKIRTRQSQTRGRRIAGKKSNITKQSNIQLRAGNYTQSSARNSQASPSSFLLTATQIPAAWSTITTYIREGWWPIPRHPVLLPRCPKTQQPYDVLRSRKYRNKPRSCYADTPLTPKRTA